jgi:hypothetical protein
MTTLKRLDSRIQPGSRVLITDGGHTASATVVRILASEGAIGGLVQVRRDGSRRLWTEAGDTVTLL